MAPPWLSCQYSWTSEATSLYEFQQECQNSGIRTDQITQNILVERVHDQHPANAAPAFQKQHDYIIKEM